MRQTAEQFIERPPRTLAALYVIHGAEPLAALEAADQLRDLARKAGYIEREVLTAESGFDWGRLTSAGSELSLFATQRLLELRVPSGKPGREGSAAIERFCSRLPEDTVTLVTLPEIDWQGKQAKWFVALESAATMIEAAPIDRDRLPGWLKGRLARQGQSADSEALEFLADRVEGNLLAAQQEIRKLALLCPPGEISLALLEDSVANVSRFNPFQLVSAIHDAVDKDDTSRIQRMLDGLKAEGEAPPLILWVMTNELRMLARVRGVTRGGRAPHPAKQRELERIARRHTHASLLALLLQAAEIDRMIKGLNPHDPWDALAELARGLAGKALMKAA
ncbi:MAG: DNA polymerase III subunit delta [Burkholderiales bacterium]|nr:DNA polymerase III subunit delta [Burkholderiales bacterium]